MSITNEPVTPVEVSDASVTTASTPPAAAPITEPTDTTTPTTPDSSITEGITSGDVSDSSSSSVTEVVDAPETSQEAPLPPAVEPPEEISNPAFIPKPAVVAEPPVTSAPIPQVTMPSPIASAVNAVAARSPTDTVISILDQKLDHYFGAMGPGKPLTADQGATFQLHLYRTIQFVLAQPPQIFPALWTHLLAAFNEHAAGMFNPQYAFRFFSAMRVAPQDLRNFERLLNLLVLTADPRSRAIKLKQIDMKTLFSGIPDQTIVQNLMAYYQA